MDNVCVYGSASVYDDAMIKDSAAIFEGDVKIGGFTTIKEGAISV